jgi:hypothetical protein
MTGPPQPEEELDDNYRNLIAWTKLPLSDDAPHDSEVVELMGKLATNEKPFQLQEL